MKAIVKELEMKLENLEDQLIFTPEDLKKYVAAWKGGLHRYSLRNYLLAVSQRPDATILAGYNTWQKLGRQVLRGQKAIKILGPRFYKKKNAKGEEEQKIYFKVVNVFDIKQTGLVIDVNYGIGGIHIHYVDPKHQTIAVGSPNEIKGVGTLTMDEFVAKVPVPVKVGYDMIMLATGADGWADGETIAIKERDNEGQMIATGMHELAHILLHKENRERPVELKELEAEATSYVVCSYFGIENLSAAKYIMNWKGNKETLKGRGKIIIKAAEEIIKLFDPKEEQKDN